MTDSTVSLSSGVDAAGTKTARLMSLDALRGFDMFCIIGLEGLIDGLKKVSDNSLVQGVASQMNHVGWAGFHFEDLIFPMFVFIVGVSLVFSLTRTIEQHGRKGAAIRIFKRAALMYLLGIFYYGGFGTPFEKIRLLGVLQRIALCYMFAGLIFCYFEKRGRILWCAGILVGYWFLLTFVPVPGGTAGNFAEGQNLTNWVDKNYLPLRKWDGDHDPEGLLSTLPAIANCLIGMFVGVWMRESKRNDIKKAMYLAGAGLILVTLGWLWNFQFPVIKKLWTSSFVFVACGYSCMLLATFHLLIEGWGLKGWAQPFVWIGMNPITIYMMHCVIDMDKVAERFVGGDFGRLYLGRYEELAMGLVIAVIVFAVARFMYQRKLFLRL